MQRQQRGKTRAASLLLLFALLVTTTPRVAPRPVSLVQQEAEAPATSSVRNKGPSAAAAASRKKPPRTTKSAFPSAAAAGGENQGDDAAASSVLLSSEIEALLFEQPPPLGDNNALALFGDQQQQQQRRRQQQQQRSTLLVAGTVDGQVHALDPSTGDLRWSFDTGEPLVKSYQQLPGTLDEKKWLIPTLDGSILVHTTQGLRRPGLKARLLVEQTPFLDPKGVFYTGSKVSRIFGVDARTGEVRQVLSGDTADSLESNRRLLARSGSDDDVIWIGRNDYTIRAFDVPTGQEEWNLTIGEFASLADLYLTASSGAGNSRTRAEAVGAAAAASAAAALSEPVPSLTATADGSLQSVAAGKGGNDNRIGGISADPPEWDVPLTAHVASVFRVSLEEGSVHTYLPMQTIPLSQSAGAGAPVVGNGSGGTAAVGILENDQVYAVALGEHGGGGSDGGEDGGAGWGPGGHGSRGKKGSRAGEGKVTHGGRTTATQPLLPHGGDWQQQQRDGGERPDADGGGSGSSSLVQSWSTKGTPQNAAVVSCPPKWCQPGHSAFPSCLVGVHTVQQITGEEQARLSLGMGSHAGGSTALDGGGGGGGAGNHDPKGVRTTSGYIGRLPRPSSQGDGAGDDLNYLTLATASRGPLESLLGWLYRGWSFVSLLLLAVVVAVVVDSRRAAQYLKRAGLGGYPLYSGGAGGGGVGGEYDPTADSGISGASEGSASGAAGGGGGGGGSLVATAGGVRGEVRVGCLTVSDTVLGYGSHGTVVYRGLLEGRPVAVKRMLTDFHARADREISLLIESDGHPNVVRYFVREEAGEFVYLALQLCQQSLHNAMAQIHSALAQSRRKLEHENGRSGAPRVGLGRALTADDVSAPRELREALLQVSQGVEHLHSLRIVHRDLKPHNILLAAKERKGPGLGRRSVGAQQAEGGEREGVGDGDGPQVAPKKLSNMQDLAKFVLKISDMGLGKQLLNGQSSFGMSSYGRAPGGRDHGQGGGGGDAAARARASNAQASSSAGGHVGSIGWQAPEVIADRVSLEGGQGPPAAIGGGAESSSLSTSRSGSGASASSWAMAGGPSLSSSRRTQAVDVFSLGCIFHHCIVPGSHPFGQWYEREANIIQDKASRITELEHVPDAHDLVSLMTAREPDLRPSAGEVCKHPFFWNEEKRLSFLLEFSDRLEQDAVQSPLLVMVEAGAHSVVGRSWDVRLDAELTEDAGRYRKYDFSSVRDLLRVVRNKRHHFHELPERVQAMMSPLPGGFLRYVEERFPQLVMHCAKVTGSLLTEERIFKEYLVHFRRPQPPAAAAVPSGTTQSGTPVAAARTASANGSASKSSAATEGAVPAAGGTGATAAGARGEVPASGGGGAAEAPPADDARGKGGSDQPGAEGGRARAPAETAALPNGGGAAAAAAAAAGAAAFTSPGKKSAKTTPRSGRKSYAAGGADGGGGDGGAGAAVARVTGQNGPRGEGALQDVLVWNESGMAKSMGCRGWWRHQDHWQRRLDVTKQRPRGAHLNKALQDPKYRTRLCSHWENSKGMLCPMRRRGAGKCDFAHGGLELRVRANKRDRWGRHVGGSNPLDGGGGGGANVNLDASGGEDTLGAARSIGRIRVENGEKDGVGVIGGGGGGGAGGARQGKRNKGGGSGGGSGGGATDRSGPRDREPRANGGGSGATAANGGGFVGPSRERGKNRSRSPRGGRGANGEAAGREARPPAVVAAEGDAAWPPLAASQAERPPPAGLQGQGQRPQEQQRPASAADSGGSSSRESRVDQVVRLVDSGAATGGRAFAQEGGVVADGSGGRGLTRPAAAAAGGMAAVTRGERPPPAERGNGKEGRKKVVAREDGVR